MKGHFLVWGNKDFMATVSVLDLVNEEEKQKLTGIVRDISKRIEGYEVEIEVKLKEEK